MRTHLPSLCLASLCAVTLASPLAAAITIPGANGTDGVLNVTQDTVIDLSQAPTGTWDQDNTANAGKGVYDASKWAVIFKYQSVTVASGKKLTFKNHGSRAPVVWLVSGNVTIDGTVSLNGGNWVPAPLIAEPGPGGFRAGQNGFTAGVSASGGFGPGGGFLTGNTGGGGGFGTVGGGGALQGMTYGNPSLLPLIGGSGGAGDPEGIYSSDKRGAGAGGGALLVACTEQVSINGELQTNGGTGVNSNGPWDTGGGSGGGIRIVCDGLVGTGKLNALGGGGWAAGGLGRIRLERAVNTNSLQVVPDPSVVPISAGSTALVWPPSNAPEVRVVSIGGQTAPADPRASFGSEGADVALPQTNTAEVVIETTNVEQASQVKVRLTPRANANATVVDATYSSQVSASPLVLRWTATVPVNTGYSAVQVRVVRP